MQWNKIENKPQFFLYSAGAVFGLWLTSSVLSAVDRVPLVRSERSSNAACAQRKPPLACSLTAKQQGLTDSWVHCS